MNARLLLTPIACMLALGVACDSGDTTAPVSDELAVAVPPGKADNYLSPTSREYLLWGMGQVTLEESWKDADAEAREAEVQARLGFQFKAYSHFINEYLTDKSSHDENKGYGGFSGLVRGTSLDFIHEPVDEAGLEWAFIWELEMGGPRDMMDRLPLEHRDNGDLYVMVTLPKLTQSQLQYASYPKSFDPAKYDGETEEIEVMVEPEDESFDAFPNYGAMFDDELLDVLILVGGDYNDERYDLKAADNIFKWLKKAGYANDAEAYTDLTLDSGPFTKTVKVDGRQVRVEVTLLHPDIVEDANLDDLRKKIIAAYETMDILIYDGHAGGDPDYSGVVYHYNPRHAIAANDFTKLDLPDKYQMYVFNGCKTYSAYPEAIYKHARKTVENLDIISTVNFSWLTMQPYTTSGLLNELLAMKAGTHDPHTYLEILAAINKSSNWNVYYGVHGLDDNAHINPYADVATLCRTCATDNDCPGAGNQCVRFEWGAACGAECTSGDGCPTGYSCMDIAASGKITGKQCLPKSLTCQ